MISFKLLNSYMPTILPYMYLEFLKFPTYASKLSCKPSSIILFSFNSHFFYLYLEAMKAFFGGSSTFPWIYSKTSLLLAMISNLTFHAEKMDESPNFSFSLKKEDIFTWLNWILQLSQRCFLQCLSPFGLVLHLSYDTMLIFQIFLCYINYFSPIKYFH